MTQFTIPPASNPPVLSKEDFDRISNPTFFVDRRVVWNLLHYIEANGFTLRSVDTAVITGRTKKQRIEQTFNEVMGVDDAWVETRDDKRAFAVHLVMGNSGWDVVSDWGIPDGDESQPWNQLMESFDPRLYL